MVAAEAVRLDRAGKGKEALSFYIDAAQMLLSLTRSETDTKKRDAFKGHALRYLERAEYLKAMQKRNQRMKERENLVKEREEYEALESGHWADKLLGNTLALADGTSATPSSYVDASSRLMLLVFAAQWSNRCRKVVPTLKKYVSDGVEEVVKVIFVSSDKSSGAYEKFRSEHGFASVPWAARERKGRLVQQYRVRESCLPQMVLFDCKANGAVLSTDAGAALQSSASSSKNPVLAWISMSSDTSVPDSVRISGDDDGDDSKNDDEVRPIIQRLAELFDKKKNDDEKGANPSSDELLKLITSEFGADAIKKHGGAINDALAALADGQRPGSTHDGATSSKRPDPSGFDPAADRPPARWADIVFGKRLLEKSGRHLPPSKLLAGRHLVSVFFGGQWSQQCRDAASSLKKFFDALASEGGEGASIENVFVSYDRDRASCSKFWRTLPGCIVPFDDRYQKGRLEGFFKVSRVPRLVVLEGGRGEIVKSDALADITSPSALKKPGDVISRWKAARKRR